MSDITVHKDSIRQRIRARRSEYSHSRGRGQLGSISSPRAREREALVKNWQHALDDLDIHPTPQRPLAAFYPTDLEPDITSILAVHVPVILPVLSTTAGELLPHAAWALHTQNDKFVKPHPRFPFQSSALPQQAEFLTSASIILIAALAVDRTGTRLGQGGGWYDRALSCTSPEAPVVACIFDWEFDEETLPRAQHDIPVDGVLTPERFVNLKAR